MYLIPSPHQPSSYFPDPTNFREEPSYFDKVLKNPEKLDYSLKATMNKALAEAIKEKIQTLSSDEFEELIRRYMVHLGADDAYIPSKRSPKRDAEGWSDADVIAVFNALKYVVFIQAKHHKEGTLTDEDGVKQILPFLERKDDDPEWRDYQRAAWVITSGDYFEGKAKNLANAKAGEQKQIVRLINSKEFAQMLADAGSEWL